MTIGRVPPPVLAIDGPSGSGKGTIARQASKALGWHLLDSGALYRLVGLAAHRQGIDLADETKVAALAGRLGIEFGVGPGGAERVLLDGIDVSPDLRTEESGRLASAVATLPAVREALLGLQRGFRRAPGLVADGRDMGTVVFADAPFKFFITASPEARAARRYKQLKEKGIDAETLDAPHRALG